MEMRVSINQKMLENEIKIYLIYRFDVSEPLNAFRKRRA